MTCNHLPGVTCDACYLTTAERGLLAESTYTDDVIAVMRDTISAQRETIAVLRAQLDESNRTLEEGAQTMAIAQAIIHADRERRAEEAGR